LALPGALPQSDVSPASWQGLWVRSSRGLPVPSPVGIQHSPIITVIQESAVEGQQSETGLRQKSETYLEPVPPWWWPSSNSGILFSFSLA
jgi:hypothetical protein